MMDRGTELALKRAVREGLATRLQGDFDPVEVESAIQSLVQEAVRAWNLGLAEPDVARLCRSVGDDFLRYGPLQGLLEDPGITEIIVNGGGVAMDAGVARFLEPHVFVERAGRLEPCPYVRFDDADHLRRIIDKIAEQAGMRCDEAHAMGCAMLPGGKARATYIVPPLAPDGPALNLRLFGDDVMSIEDLTARGALSPVMAEFLGSAVRARCPVIISGGTGSGKTTMLGALSGFIPDDERVLPSRIRLSCGCVPRTSSGCRLARRIPRAKGPLACASWWRSRCAGAPIASSWANAAGRRLTRCCRRCRPTTQAR